MERSEEVVKNLQAMELALNAVKVAAERDGLWDDNAAAEVVTTPYGEFTVNEQGQYSFTWFA